jgi:hypothetical protein
MGDVVIRLTGLPEDVEAIAAILRNSLEVVEEEPDEQHTDCEYIKYHLYVRQPVSSKIGSQPAGDVVQSKQY